MKTAKKLLAVLMCMTMLFGVMCVGADAIVGDLYSEGADPFPGYEECDYSNETAIGPLHFVLMGDHARLIFIDFKAEGEIVVPATVEGLPVTEITAPINMYFGRHMAVTKVVLPDSVTMIGVAAFNSFVALEEVNIPEGVTCIGSYAFNDCKMLKKVQLPQSLKYICSRAFSGCESLKEINIPSGVVTVGAEAFSGTAFYNDKANWDGNMLVRDGALLAVNDESVEKFSIGDDLRLVAADAFGNCGNLREISIPAGLRYLSYNAFGGTESLMRFTVDPSNPYYTTDKYGVLYSKDRTVLVAFPYGFASIGYNMPNGMKRIETVLQGGYATIFSLPKSVEYFYDIGDNVAFLAFDGTKEEFADIEGSEKLLCQIAEGERTVTVINKGDGGRSAIQATLLKATISVVTIIYLPVVKLWSLLLRAN